MTLNIDGPESGVLSEAIESAFPGPGGLQRVIKFKLDDNIYNYAGLDGDYPQIRFDLIGQYNARWHIDRLVAALLEQVPDNGKLLHFAWRHGIVARTDGAALGDAELALERMVDPERQFANPEAFLRRFGQILGRVCRVEVPTDEGSVFGTGFLIGDETLITNYHVVSDVIEGTRGADPSRVKLLFDYRADADGKEVAPGVEHGLADDPVVDASPYDPKDVEGLTMEQSLGATRSPQNLDYAVLRVRGAPGSKPLGSAPEPGGAPRGHLELPDRPDAEWEDEFAVSWSQAGDRVSALLYIMQHPDKRPLTFDMNKPAVLGRDAEKTRVLYQVNTLGGSSGSPVFNAKLELVALHHAGDANWSPGHRPEFNQGIPIQRIRKLLAERGKLDEIR